MLKRIVWSTPLVVIAACASGDPNEPEMVGEARLSIVQVPADVRCASITVAGNRTVQKSFDLTPGQSSVLNMNQLPVGAVTLSASAYDSACSAVTGASVPTWVATPAAASLSSNAVTDVTLKLQRNGRANVNLDFDDGPSCGANGVSCAAASDCCSAICTAGVCAPMGGSGANCSAPTGAATAHLTQLFSVTQPLGFETAPGDATNVYIVERTGKIRVGAPTNPMPGIFLDIPTLAGTSGEQGLLGLAFHPNYAANGRFFVAYANTAGGTNNVTVAEYRRSAANPLVADSAPTQTLFTVAKPATNHNAGQLEFGPDGFLYIAMGDGGGANDPGGNAQNLNSLLGKMLRIDVSGAMGYTSPVGNMTGGKPEIWDLGLRNPWRFSFDACSGDLYISDVGQNLTEEINVEPKNTGKKNYGWATVEGTTCVMAGCNTTGLTAPTFTYPAPAAGNCAVIGGHVYRGNKIPGLRGRYVYGDFCSGRIWSVAPGGMPTELLVQPGMQLASFGVDQANELYAVSQGGQVYRLDP